MVTPRKSASPACIQLIKSFEGICDGDPSTVNLDPYLDPLKIWSIGWGHVIRHAGRPLRGEKDRADARAIYPRGLTYAECEDLLRNDVVPFGIYLAAVFPQLTQNQFDALLSFAFNVGLGNLESSTLFKLLKIGDLRGAAAQFARWNKGRDDEGTLVVLPGLIRRRAAERALFLSAEKS